MSRYWGVLMGHRECITKKPASWFCAGGIGFSLASWNIIHETGFVFMAGTVASEFTMNHAWYSCTCSILGGLFTACIVLLLGKKHRWDSAPFRRRTFFISLLIVQLILGATYYYSLLYLQNIALVSCFHFLLNITFYTLLFATIRHSYSVDSNEIVHILVIGVVLYALLELCYGLVLFPLTYPVIDIVVIFLFFAAAVFCSWRFFKMVPLDEAPQRQEPESPHKVRIPIPLVIHIMLYAFVFGIAHNIATGVVSVPDMKLTVSHLGMLSGAIAFYLTFLINADKGRTWSKIKMVVFPLVMLGFIFLPLATDSSSMLSILFSECAMACYSMVFILSCISIARRISVDVVITTATGLALFLTGYVIGVAVGNVIKVYMLMNPLVSDVVVYSFLDAIVFMTMVAATFWVGDDRKVSLLWGMEEKLSPKMKESRQLHEKCEAVADSYMLTKRESVVLELLAVGKRPTQIAEELVVSISTVRSHIHSIYEKLDVHSYTELTSVIDETKVE